MQPFPLPPASQYDVSAILEDINFYSPFAPFPSKNGTFMSSKIDQQVLTLAGGMLITSKYSLKERQGWELQVQIGEKLRGLWKGISRIGKWKLKLSTTPLLTYLLTKESLAPPPILPLPL